MKCFNFLKVLSVTLLLLFGGNIALFAVDYKFRHYTVDNGLASNTVRCILQDRTGYVWVGTTDGLCRFAGPHIKVFRHDSNDSTSIGSNEISSLFEDSEGFLWVGTKGGVYIYDPMIDSFSLFVNKDFFSPRTYFNSIVGDLDGNIWLGTHKDGLFKYCTKSDSLIHFSKDIISESITELFVDHKGEIWISTYAEECIYGYNVNTGKIQKKSFEKLDTKGAFLNNKTITEDSQGNIWITGQNSSLLRLDRERKDMTLIKPTDPKYIVSRIHNIVEYQTGVFFLGTNDGILIYDYLKKQFDKVDCEYDNIDGLNDPFVFSLMKDKEGGLWAGTYFGGLNYLSPTSSLFDLYRKSPMGSLDKHFIVSKFCEDNSGNIWIGSDNGGLGKFVPSNKTFTHVVLDKDHPNLNIHALYADDTFLWVGTYLTGIYRQNRHTKKVKHYPEPNSITSFYRDIHGTLWIGARSGVYIYEAKSDRFLMKFNPGTNCDILDIVGDGIGNIWFASKGGGLVTWNLLTEKVTYYSKEKEDKNYVTNVFRALCLHRDRLWVGTSGQGLWYFDTKKQCLLKEKFHQNLDVATIYSIVPHDDHLWLTTNKGLGKHNIDNGKTTWYTEEDGLQGRLFNPNAGLKSSSGKIYLGGSLGFNVFDPNLITENRRILPIVFTNFQLFGEDIPIENNGILQEHINTQRSVVLGAKQNSFTIDFVALSYLSPLKTTYFYRLKGFDKEWIRVKGHESSSAWYTNLPSGNYVFEVKTENGIGDESMAEIMISILPPWWATVWMLSLYVFLVIGGGIAFFVNLFRRIERRQVLLLRDLKQKSDQELLESKIRIFQEVAHEIRTPVTLIAAPAEEILQSTELPENVREDLEIIKKNSDRLVELMNEVLDFSRSNLKTSSISLKQVDVCESLSVITDRFISIAKRQKIDLSLKLPENPPLLTEMDVESFDKIVSNLMTNALKFTRDRIEICLQKTDTSFFELIIWDNGIGIEDKQPIFDLFYSSTEQNNANLKGFGIGLAVVKLLLKKMNASIRVESKLGEYTAFYIQFPLKISSDSTGDILLPILEPSPSEMDSNDERSTVLIVEDNDSLRHFLAKSLKAFYHVYTAANGKEAISILEKSNVDIVISDVMMPEMDGWELCDYIKNNNAINHIPIILLTADTDINSKIRALENGADIYVEKPVVMKYLHAQIAGILDKRKQLRGKFANTPLEPISNVVKNQKEEAFIIQVNQIIEENLSNSEFSMDEIADKLCMGRTAMYAKIKAISGLTPNNFVRLIRLRKAAELFRSGEDYKINEVCYIVGFSSPSYFSKCFQQQFGVLPGDFILNK